MRILAFKDSLPLLETLLARCSEQPPPDPEGRNLIHFAASGGSLECLQYPEKRGLDL